MRLVRFTRPDGDVVFINPDHVVTVKENRMDSTTTDVWTQTDACITVDENINTVVLRLMTGVTLNAREVTP